MKKIYLSFLTILLLLLISGCGTGGKPGQVKKPGLMPEKIVVQAPTAPPTAPLFKMIEDGLPEGTKMELIIYRSVEEATTRVSKGEADFSVLPVNVAAKLYNAGIDVSMANVSTWGILYLVSLDGQVENWTDLKGRELYVGARGSTPDVLTQYFLIKNGLKEGDVRLTYLGSPEIAQMMIQGLVTHAVLPEPMVTQVLQRSAQARVVRDFYVDWQHFEGESANLPQAGMVVSNKFAEAYPDAVAEFHRVYADALAWTMANPNNAGQLVETNLNIPAPVFVKSMERTRLSFAAGADARSDVNTYLARLLELSEDMVGGKLPDDQFYLAD